MSLTQIGEAIWIAEGEIVDFHGFAYPTRCVLVKLPDGALWVWSPVALTPALQKAVEILGKPAHLVSPNKIHHLYLQDWKARWPDARIWGPQTTISKRNDLSFEDALEDNTPHDWQGVFDQAWFRGSFFMDEIVFFHAPSRTVILADLSENFSDGFLAAHWSAWKRAGARVWGIVEGKGYAPLEWRWSFLSRGPLRAAKRKVLGWNPEKVVMAHGVWQPSGGLAYLERAFRWM
ncbi:MAG: DUF4336 domain-containing protein [Sulfitobacter sp.]